MPKRVKRWRLSDVVRAMMKASDHPGWSSNVGSHPTRMRFCRARSSLSSIVLAFY